MTQNASKILRSILSTAILVSLIGCGTQKAFDREKAAKDIADSEKFKDCHTGMNNWDACNWSIYTGQWEAIAGYWGSSKNRLQADSLRANPVGYWLYRDKGYLQLASSPKTLSLSDKGRTASKEWTQVTLPGKAAVNSIHEPLERWEVPLATKKFVAITNVLRGQRMGVQFAQVNYTWVYSLTSLGTELFKNEKLPSTARSDEWSAPTALTSIDLRKTYEDQATFTLDHGSWDLQEDCKRMDIC
jgi:hypothetical protein